MKVICREVYPGKRRVQVYALKIEHPQENNCKMREFKSSFPVKQSGKPDIQNKCLLIGHPQNENSK